MKRMTLLLMVLALAIGAAAYAIAEMGMPDPMSAGSPLASVTAPPTFTIENVKHVVNGVALRNRASGVIPVRGVPKGASVNKAYLYWNFSDGLTAGPQSKVLFNGNIVTGTLVANNPDLCWGLSGNHTYRALVNQYITKVNADQEFRLITPDPVATNGANPWATLASNPNLEGAALVVVYKKTNLTTGSRVAIYDKLSGTAITTSGGSTALTLTHPPAGLAGSGVFSMVGADGQRGSGHDNSATGEITRFNGVQIAGPGGPAGSSPNVDWDGSAGWPLVQLWDVHTHLVTLAGTSSLVTWTTVNDCIAPVVVVLQQGTNN